MTFCGTYVLTQPGQNLHKLPNLATLLTATLQRGTARHHFDSYFIEFIWRQAQAVNGEDCFQSVLKAIAKRFQPKK